MGSFSDDDEEYRFFDACADLDSDCMRCPESSCLVDYCVYSSFDCDVWIRSPRSIQERRSKFFQWFGLDLDMTTADNSVYVNGDVFKGETERIIESSGAVLRTSIFRNEFSCNQSSVSSWSSDVLDLSRGSGSNEGFICRSGDSNGAMECNLGELGQAGKLGKAQVVGVNQLVTAEGLENSSGSSCSVQHAVQREIGVESNLSRTMNRSKSGWLSRLLSMACIVDEHGKSDYGSDQNQGHGVQRVRVHHSKKQSKELSALFLGQDIQAHEGSIIAMKFSFDGQFLASAGEDRIVRVWQVVEDERSNETDILDIDPSCVYFTVNTLSELAPLVPEKEKISKLKNLRKTADSACVIFPPKVFRLLEKPIHEFHGHGAEILDLSWSTNNYLISSSTDKTVRLWRVGCEHCLRVFSHSNYGAPPAVGIFISKIDLMTCVQFDPVDENHFISGSIDGKVRIWAIDRCQVVDWTAIRDIVTAIGYRPDGQGGIIGTLTGNCRLFNLTGNPNSPYNHFQLEALACLNSKRKSQGKRIIGFEFFPQDSSKVMVTSADSQVRILYGVNVIGKYRGPRNAGNQISAFFTSDGKHIVSACKDSNVYVWNCISQEESSLSQQKTIKSFECFTTDASVAIPWPGLKSRKLDNGLQLRALDDNLPKMLPLSSSPCFTLGQEFLLEPMTKGSATWPEEKLPSSSQQPVLSTVCKSEYKFLKTSCQSSSNSHAWGLVIVTAGWDGRIKSFHNYGLPVLL
ncbi:unnamed protein product [Ilex paraguariensis]|uniref:WD repeat-containing protein 44 n=1 Tax=Ilex paraguariensis TaxID=185542 RepID=A0ABC8RSJ1_9AQUA